MTQPVQRTFSPQFTAIYRGDITDAIGQIMGPNTMGEYFRLDHVEDLHDGRWRGHFEIATSQDFADADRVVAGHVTEPGGAR